MDDGIAKEMERQINACFSDIYNVNTIMWAALYRILADQGGPPTERTAAGLEEIADDMDAIPHPLGSRRGDTAMIRAVAGAIRGPETPPERGSPAWRPVVIK